MASKLFIKGKQLSGAVANALKINCKDKNGNKSNVQAELNKIQDNLNGLRFGVDGDGNYGYYGADGSLIPFKNYDVGVVEVDSSLQFSVELGYRPSAILLGGCESPYASFYVLMSNGESYNMRKYNATAEGGHTVTITDTGFTASVPYDISYIWCSMR